MNKQIHAQNRKQDYPFLGVPVFNMSFTHKTKKYAETIHVVFWRGYLVVLL